jgi:hypothetical protein
MLMYLMLLNLIKKMKLITMKHIKGMKAIILNDLD